MRAIVEPRKAASVTRAVVVAALIFISAPNAFAERANSGDAVARNAEFQQQAVQTVYRDIVDVLNGMQRVLAQKQRLADATSSVSQALANSPREERRPMPTYDDVSEPAEPCKGERLEDWRRCLAQVDQNVARLGEADRRSLAPQVATLRARVNAVSSDARVSAADLQVWTAQLRRTAQTLDAIRINRPLPR